MPVKIEKAGALYTASISPPHGSEPWKTREPMGARELSAELLRRGLHQQDIGDAFYGANPNWIEELQVKMDIQDFYKRIDSFIVMLRDSGNEKAADVLDHRLHKVSWTTGSELLNELIECLKKVAGSLSGNLEAERTELETIARTLGGDH